MFLTLSEKVLADLSVLGSIDPVFIDEFCKVSIQFITSGPNPGMIATAANALKVEKEVVVRAIMSLTDVMIDAARHNLSQQDFNGSLGDVLISEDVKKSISEFYNANLKIFKVKLAESFGVIAAETSNQSINLSSSLPQFKNLDWRLEVEVASRHSQNTLEPKFTMRLDTAKPGIKDGSNSLMFNCDYTTLSATTAKLENAVAEMKSAHSRRVLRYF